MLITVHRKEFFTSFARTYLPLKEKSSKNILLYKYAQYAYNYFKQKWG
jgi:hypothetical protein